MSTLTILHSLTLFSSSISNIDFLMGMMGLTDLDLQENLIRDLAPMAALANLGYLWLSYNPITNLSGLSALTNLYAVYLDEIAATDFIPLPFIC
ncbi:MAG TPA: hypothetical protein VGK40_09165 [Verrucomicrobiae bacterium]